MTMFIELRTLFIVDVLSSVLGIIVMTSLWRQNQKRSPEIVLWLADYVLQSVAVLLIILRNIIPDLFSIVLANVFIIGGTIILNIGLERYVGEKSRQLHNYIMLAVFTFIHIFCTYVYPSLALRNINFSLAFLYICTQSSWLMLYRVHQNLRPATRATGIVFLMICILNVIRIIDNLSHAQGSQFFMSGLLTAIVILAQVILFIALTFALFLLVSRRLLTTLENEVVKHKQTEDTLRESRQQFQGLVETLYDWVWEVDSNGHYTYVSPQIKNILGYEPQEILGKSPYDFMTPEEARRVSEIVGTSIKEEKPIIALENKNIHKDGHIVIIEINGCPFYDIEGKFIGYRGTDHDITDRKQAEEEIKKSEEKVRLLLNSTAEAIYGIDSNGNCTFANPSCLRMLGYTDIDQMLGKNMHQLIHHSYSDGTPMPVEVCKIYKAFREGKRMHVDDEFLCGADGSCFPVEYWSYPQMVNGVVSGAVVTFINITERKQAEEALKESSEYLNNLIGYANAPIIVWDTDFKITRFNRAFERITGMSAEDVIGKHIELLFPEETKKQSLEYISNTVSGIKWETVEIPIRHIDGTIRTLLWNSANIYSAQGNLISTIAQGQDITERKLAEEQIHHMATHDMLTGLPSLKLAKDRLSVAMSTARRYENMSAVMFIDLDGFKEVNDALGHDAGDYVLKQVAEHLLSSVRESDTVARIGGDEFLIIAGGLHSPDDAARIAQQAIRLVSQPIALDAGQVEVYASIGIALYPSGGENMDQLIKQADEAMYRVKNTGKNNFAFADNILN